MGENKNFIKITNYLDIEFLISAYAHIRVLMEDAGLSIHQGVVLYIPDPVQAETIISDLELCGAVRGLIRGHKLPTAYNHTPVVVLCQATHSRDSILEFLNCSDYFPILVISGRLPKWVYDCNILNILFVETLDAEDNFESSFGKRRAELFSKFLDFSHQYTQTLVNFLSKIEHQSWFENVSHRKSLYKALFCIGKVCEFHWQITCTGGDLPDNYNDFLDGIICSTLDFEDFEMNMGPTFYQALDQCLHFEKDILVGPLNKIEGPLIKAVQAEEAFLYDDNFYYMPDTVFKKVVGQLPFEISSHSVKAILLQERVLVCNNVRGNYSIQKELVTAFGERMRKHFLKISKEQLEMGEELSLIERRKPYVHRTM